MLNRLSGQYRIRILAIVAMAATGFFCQYSEAMAADAVKARKDIKAMGLEFTGSAFATVAGNDDLTAVQLFLDAGMDVNAGGGAAIGVAASRGKARQGADGAVPFVERGETDCQRAALCDDARLPGDC